MPGLAVRAHTGKTPEQKRAAMRTAIVLGVIALVIYLSVFIRSWS
jgi:hypothetical protein